MLKTNHKILIGLGIIVLIIIIYKFIEWLKNKSNTISNSTSGRYMSQQSNEQIQNAFRGIGADEYGNVSPTTQRFIFNLLSTRTLQQIYASPYLTGDSTKWFPKKSGNIRDSFSMSREQLINEIYNQLGKNPNIIYNISNEVKSLPSNHIAFNTNNSSRITSGQISWLPCKNCHSAPPIHIIGENHEFGTIACDF